MWKKIGDYGLVAVVLTWVCLSSFAHCDVNVSAELSSTEIPLNGTVLLTVTIDGPEAGDVEQPRLPAMAGLSVIGSSQSSQFSWVNGKTNSTKRFQYTLVPLQDGTLNIPPINVAVSGKRYQTQELTLSVGKQTAAPAQQRGPGHVTAQAEPEGQPPMFLTAAVTNWAPYVGEQIIYSVKFYHRVKLFGGANYYPPEFKGFVAYKLDENARTYQEIVGNREYLVKEIRTILVPTYEAAKLEIPAARIDAQIGFFEDPRSVLSKPQTLRILPLPAAASANIGGVGEYTVNVRFDNTLVSVGDAINVVIEVKGEGNLREVILPEILLPEDIKKFDSKEKVEHKVVNGRLTGTKKSDLILIPGVAGTYKLNPLSFIYFSPAKKKYLTVSVQLPELVVKKGNGASVPAADNVINKKTVSELQKDINYIREDGEVRSYIEPYKLPYYKWPVLLVVLLVFFDVIYLAWGSFKRRNIHDFRKRGSVRNGLKKLAAAKKLKDPGQFYCTVSDSVNSVFADQFGISAQGITSTDIAQKSSAVGVPQELINEVLDIVSACDGARYSGTRLDEAYRAGLYNRSLKALQELGRYF